MTDEHLSDRIPDVAAGRAAWSAAEAEHLARCASCAAEWRLVADWRTPEMPAIDVGRISAAVLARLATTPAVVPAPRAGWRRWATGLAAAASIALAVALWWPWAEAPQVAAVPAREPTMLPELDRLLDAELEVVLAALEPDPVEPLGAVPRIGDLTDHELEQLLEEVEGS